MDLVHHNRGKDLYPGALETQLGWNDLLLELLTARWLEFKTMLQLMCINIPRCLGTSSSSISMEFYGFSDVSQQALGAVIYLRVLDGFDNVWVCLVTAKSKVAPLKKTTIPRLELSAAVLLIRLLTLVQTALKLQTAPSPL